MFQPMARRTRKYSRSHRSGVFFSPNVIVRCSSITFEEPPERPENNRMAAFRTLVENGMTAQSGDL